MKPKARSSVPPWAVGIMFSILCALIGVIWSRAEKAVDQSEATTRDVEVLKSQRGETDRRFEELSTRINKVWTGVEKTNDKLDQLLQRK